MIYRLPVFYRPQLEGGDEDAISDTDAMMDAGGSVNGGWWMVDGSWRHSRVPVPHETGLFSLELKVPRRSDPGDDVEREREREKRTKGGEGVRG